ncbi:MULTISPECIES: macrolide family glycosyltransferase [Actinoalloteichus]|uniref:Glycosyltransferase, MGT family n=1 Tax=Actinoalloteichus fjordicus TaxID=1612552 RepID=A0AAC9LEV9_9PSEU|nr:MULTISPECIES: macrolide family glycosyltransferase [Actinoalloteichus]APU15482.1 glycosyltransferase, MGT family [Actinoalloteichus fjordicus]APU21549.1 glycosyltransferase, MGT family [Actinoalloteichus sp. GBA129-24]
MTERRSEPDSTTAPGHDRRHIACMLYPAHGHTMPAVEVVAELVRRGNRVTCFVGDLGADDIAATGAEIVRYDVPLSVEPPLVDPTVDEIAEASLRLVVETSAACDVVAARLSDDVPDVLLCDIIFYLPGGVLAQKWDRPVARLLPVFASNEHFSLQERLSVGVDQIDFAHPAMQEVDTRLAEFRASHGLTTDDQTGFFPGDTELSLVFIPREFQFQGETFGADHAFVGPCRPRTSLLPQESRWSPPGDGLPVVLISLGTVDNDRPDFFRVCATAFEDLPWHVVMTIGDKVGEAAVGPLPPNVEVHPWIPQAEVLAHAAVFVCPGGMGSIMGSLSFGVPLVVVPRHPEQYANAERVAELGLGRLLPSDDVTGETLRTAVLAVSDSASVRDRLRDMQADIERAGGARLAADHVEELLRARGARPV